MIETVDMEPDFCRLIKGGVEENLEKLLSLRGLRRRKDDGSWVTEGDLFVQRLATDLLSASGYAGETVLISEEMRPDLEKAHASDYIVTLDPVDGTSNFTYGMAEWGVIVSVYKRMEHFQSMIFLPEMRRCLITGDRFERPCGASLAGLSSIVPAEDYVALGKECEYRMTGSCAVNFYYMVTGSYRTLRHYRGAYSWDIMAGLNLALEHGLKAFVDGRPYGGEWLAPGKRYKYFVSE